MSCMMKSTEFADDLRTFAFCGNYIPSKNYTAQYDFEEFRWQNEVAV